MNPCDRRAGSLPATDAQHPPSCLCGGFTLTEFLFASTLALLLFLIMLEALFFCRRSAANIKWRLAADALAYDIALERFNLKTDWFESNATTAQADWKPVPAERTSVWLNGQPAYYYCAIIPVGTPAAYWQILVDVQWPLLDGRTARLPQPYLMERHRADRNLFRNTP